MSDQNITPDLLVELSTEEQQLLSGGIYGYYGGYGRGYGRGYGHHYGRRYGHHYGRRYC
ncbi:MULTISPECIES: hypothetical protein [Nostoc]|uniref:Bacteriocin n=2 Tax=Nostoc TaxID=1177 RepID=A0ABR8I3Z3_9NOSO|nr:MULTISPECIES: hypothetical protein [Nostoc]MBD2560244.1 hypothetical protein [Nostoc linckia FACHB-391]MBD2645899.1 hypothetical protein [Nostoc foliaceum FACHB-393]